MNQSKIYVLSTDTNVPCGGIKQLYRHVDILNAAGFDASIVHAQNKFRCTWFENHTPICYLDRIRLEKTDFLVVPEVFGELFEPGKATGGINKKIKSLIESSQNIVIFNQNCYLSFHGYSVSTGPMNSFWLSNALRAVIVVSEDSRQYMNYVFPDIPIVRIHNSINSQLFSYQDRKKKQICFMTRKLSNDAAQVINILKYRNALGEFELMPIENRPEREVADIMKESLIFLSFSDREGCALPPKEAMMCGCLVVGYDGRGGRECFKPEFSYPIENGDILSFEKTVESLIRQYDQNPVIPEEKRKKASTFIGTTYSPQIETQEVVQCWKQIATLPADKNKDLLMNRSLFVFVRAVRWLLFDLHQGKLRKIWGIFRIGGIPLCWHYMKERFSSRNISYDALRNLLSRSQSDLILSQCSWKPLISIVVPVYKVNRRWLEKCIESVVNQYYSNWELILVDDASQQDDLRHLIDDWALRDHRIRCFYSGENAGIAQTTNTGIKIAGGEFIAFLDHDDELTPDALTWVVWALSRNPKALWLYSDEDMMTANGHCHDPHFKPDFSPEFLLSNMFTCHLSVYSAQVLNRIGGLREGFDGSQDHDLALRLSEIIDKEHIIHIPRVLYHWRKHPASTAADIAAKPQAPLAGRQAVTEALQRRGIKGKVTSYELCPTVYQIEYEPSEFPKVSILISTRNKARLVSKCIDSVRKWTHYPHFEIVIIDNVSDASNNLEDINHQGSENKINIMRYDKPFNLSEMNNLAVGAIQSDYVLFMNSDIEILSDNWLAQLVGTAQSDPSIAVVGGMLLYPNRHVQHASFVLGVYGTAGHANKYIYHRLPGYLGRLHTVQEVSGISAAMALVRRSALLQVGGFDGQRYPTLYNDVDLCIRLKKAGYRCIYNPMVRAIHYETRTQPNSPAELLYKQRLQDDHAEILKRDPFYNPNLSLSNEQFWGLREFSVEEQIPELSNLRE